jgi:hypothetical protein
MPRQGETGVTEKSRAPVQDGTLGEYKLGGYATAFLGASAGVCFAAPLPRKFTSS